MKANAPVLKMFVVVVVVISNMYVRNSQDKHHKTWVVIESKA